MEATRKALHEAIDKYGLDSKEALNASEEMDKHIAVAQVQKRLSKAEFMAKVVNDLDKKKQKAKHNEADCYLYEKGRMVGKKTIKHKQRQPYWKSK